MHGRQGRRLRRRHAHAAGDHGDAGGAGDGGGQFAVEAGLDAVGIHRREQNFTRAEFFAGLYIYGNPESKLYDPNKATPLLLDAAERAGVVHVVGCEFRYDTAWALLADIEGVSRIDEVLLFPVDLATQRRAPAGQQRGARPGAPSYGRATLAMSADGARESRREFAVGGGDLVAGACVVDGPGAAFDEAGYGRQFDMIAAAGGLPVWQYGLAAWLGTLPYYFVLAWLGTRFHFPPGTLLCVLAVVFVLAVLEHARRRSEEDDGE